MYTEEGVSTICNVGMESLALCKERVVGVADNKVYFSDVDDFSRWNEITLPEKVCAVTQLQEDVLLFGKDVLRLNFGKDVADTTVETVCRNVGIPFAQTLCAVGNSVVYLTANGLMKFKNSSVTKLAEAFADNAEAQATVLAESTLFVATPRNKRAFCWKRTAKRGKASLSVKPILLPQTATDCCLAWTERFAPSARKKPTLSGKVIRKVSVTPQQKNICAN